MNSSAHKDPTWDPTEHYKDPDVAREYDAIRFSSLAGKIYVRLERHFLLKALSTVPIGATVADVPCGTGRLAEIMLEAGYRVLGIDISPEMLKVAKTRLAGHGDKFTTRVGDARELTKGDKLVDAVLCARVLMHFPLEEQIRFLNGVKQITNGPIIFTQSFDGSYQRFRRSIKKMLGHQQPAQYPISSSQISRLLQGSGLKEVTRFRLFPAISEAMIVVTTKA